MALEILEQYANQCYVCKMVGFKGHTAKKRLHKYANERHITLQILQKLLSQICSGILLYFINFGSLRFQISYSTTFIMTIKRATRAQGKMNQSCYCKLLISNPSVDKWQVSLKRVQFWNLQPYSNLFVQSIGTLRSRRRILSFAGTSGKHNGCCGNVFV